MLNLLTHYTTLQNNKQD